MGRIFTIGECLIDFIPTDSKDSLKNVSSFIKMAGGAPANVAVACSKLGSESYFIGMLGDDFFGDFLVETLENYGVNTKYTYRTSKAKTSLAFVNIGKDGSREFSFYRNPGADMFLDINDVKSIEFSENDFVSFCSVGLVPYPIKYATEYLLKKAKLSNSTIVFDPNVRLDLWSDVNLCRETILNFIKYSDILKVSDDEIEFITGKDNLEESVSYLKDKGAKNIILTLGKNGSSAYFNDKYIKVDGFNVVAIDTTGAGDSFVGAMIHMLDEIGKKPYDLNTQDIKTILEFSNKVGALVSTKKGAMESLPIKSEVI